MRRDNLVFAISGIFFGLMVGWIIGTQQAATGNLRGTQPQAAAVSAPTPSPTASGGGQRAAVLDEARVRTLEGAAGQRPDDAVVRVELGNLYFDAERFQDAVTWYQQALKLDPRNVNASTDLGVSYYYLNQPDKALEQFAHSLSVDPKHTKTLLNMGIVRAFGKEDLKGAQEAWQQVLELAPDSPEGRAARQALDGMKSAHPDLAPAPATPGAAGTYFVMFMLVLGWVVRIVLLLLVLRLLIRFVAGIVQGYTGVPVGGGGGGASRVSRGSGVHLVKDPVCGTYVVPAKALTTHAAGVTHHFCSEACRDTFERRRRASGSA